MKEEKFQKLVKLIKKYDDTGFTGRIVEAGTIGEAKLFSLNLGEPNDLFKVKVKKQAWGDGEITVRRDALEFL